MQKLELLAPAKNFELGKTAINHGADAVYIGANRFGARESAANSIDDIEKLVKYAHQYYAKVYITENTVFYENELEQARQLAVDAYNTGCDALIIQDMALLEMDLPPIPLFASTQANNRTLEHVKFLENVGFDRVILARELSLKQIGEIAKNTNIELEFFVHGSLCVSYSGQCYLSCALTGRSANRGCCAQLCRSAYDLIDKNGKIIVKNKHLLSLKDLNLSAHLEDLIKAGISSFKIEGRLKDASYVKNTVAYYRKRLDDFLNANPDYEKSSSGSTALLFEPDVNLSFSRGFTNYFIDGRRKKTASLNTAKSIGEEIGKIKYTARNYFVTDNGKSLQNGDGICFFDNHEKICGTRINTVVREKIFPASMENLKIKTKIFRSYNQSFEKSMKQKTAFRKINAIIKFTDDKEKITLQATDEDKNSVTFEIPQTGDVAENTELAVNNIIENLSKTNSIFCFRVEICSNRIPFYQTSAINEWRRRIVELLLAEREKNHFQKKSKIIKNNIPLNKNSLDYTSNIANSLSAEFYKRHGVSEMQNAFEIGNSTENKILMFNKYCIRHELGLCKHGHNEDLFLLNNRQILRISFDCKKCEMKICINSNLKIKK
ncbi:MAG: U32 family peptidase [Prevotellaceae bacterium]|jgi:putative protease|nr:U32 family peptidase [Prevotellaceae bacterium]